MNSTAERSATQLLLHTVDRAELVSALQHRLEPAAVRLPCLLQVNIDREDQKSGVLSEALDALADRVSAASCLELRGLMAIPRPLEDVGEAALAQSFDAMRDLLASIDDRIAPGRAPVLSLGMSADFELAIAHGATHVRVGSALFGPRS